MIRKIKYASKLLSIALVLVILIPNISWAATAYNISPKPQAIRGDGESLVWMSYVDNNWDIYQMNLSNGKVTRITNDPKTQGYPDIWKNYIVWQDNRYREEGFDIYLYDMTTKTEKKISHLSGNHQNPLIAENKVVWINEIEGNRRVVLYDILTDSTFHLSSNDSMAFGLEFDGNIAAWMDSREGNFNIYTVSTFDMTEKQITFGLGDEVTPLVSNGKVVWKVRHNDVDHVYMYEMDTGYTTRLTVGTENHKPIAFSGDSLLMVRGNQLILNNVESIIDNPIKSVSGKIPEKAILNGNQVIWFDGDKVMTDSIDQAIQRAQITDAPSVPLDKYSNYIPLDPQNVQAEASDKKLIQAGVENIITFEEEKITFIIPEGAFHEDVYLKLSLEQPYEKIGYTMVTNIYRWEFEGGQPLLPITVTLQYNKEELKENPKKIAAYNMTKEPIPIEAYHNHETAEITFKRNGDSAAALMIYSKTFIDMNHHWASEVVDIVASHHIIDGYEDGTFRPNRNMTRAEFIKILVSSLFVEIEENTKQVFQDVPVDFWGAPYIYAAQKRGWVMGSQDKFNPNQPITRQEMITVFMRIYENITEEQLLYKEVDLSNYTDKENISWWALEHMKKAVAIGLIKGYDNCLAPTDYATRGEAATFLYRYLEQLKKI